MIRGFVSQQTNRLQPGLSGFCTRQKWNFPFHRHCDHSWTGAYTAAHGMRIECCNPAAWNWPVTRNIAPCSSGVLLDTLPCRANIS